MKRLLQWWRRETGQLRPLLRVSLRGFLENELTSAEGNVLETLAYILALLIAGSICVSFLFVIKYYFALGVREWEFREAVSWADKEFLISLSMAVTSFVTVLAWDSLYPDRRDCMILTSLPVRMRSIFIARILSILVLLGCCTVAVNSFSTVVFPLMVLSERLSWSAFFAYASAHLISLSAAGCFAFSSLLALQGLLAIVLGYRQFRWISTWVQFGVLLGILCLFFMMPDIAYRETLADANRLRMAMWLPPFWFLGLYQSLLGSGDDFVLALARAARLGLLAAAVAACVMYASGYVRHVRAAMEEAELEPRRASPGGAFSRNWLKRLLLRSPVQAAVFHFVARTMRRNRRHRLLLAISGTVGLAYVFEAVAALVRQDSPGYWLRPTAEAISVPLVLAFFLLLGMRLLFRLPVELQANWIFRLTESGSPGAYFSAVRKVMICYVLAPVALAPFPVYGALWGWRAACMHLLLVVLILLILMERLLSGLDQIPFTSSYFPGKANLKVKFGLYWVLFVTLTFVVTHLEEWLLHRPVKLLAVALLLSGWLCREVVKRRRREAELPGLSYEQRPDWGVITLGLSR